MKQSKLDSGSIQWIKDNTKEFTEDLIRKSELVKFFYKELEPYRIRKDVLNFSIDVLSVW
jgi:hypothetical protein